MFINTSNYVTGLSGSGIDTEETVDQMMKSERTKYDKMYQNKQKAQWKKNTYLDFNTQISAFREKVFNLKLQSNFNLKKTTASNASAVSITASSTASNGSMTMQIDKLAKGAYLTSSKSLKDSANIDADGNFKSDMTLTVNDIVINVSAGDAASDIAKQINNISGLSASYDSRTGRFFLSTTEMGKNVAIKLDEAAAKALGMGDSAVSVSGQNAEFTLNGAKFEESSNSFTINGMTFNLKETTASEFTVSTETDVDGIYENIKAFADAYNTLIEGINKKTSEKKNSDYPPLTEAQKEEMDDDEIEKWEKKAQEGLFRNDSILTGVTSSMRTALASAVTLKDGSSMSIWDIGIDTGSYSTNGRLVLDESKLKAAIAEDPDAIVQFFTSNGKTDKEQNGIFQRIQESLDTAMSDIAAEAGKTTAVENESVLGKQITKLTSSMAAELARLKKVETKYYNQFSQMESYIASMSSQMSMFSTYTG